MSTATLPNTAAQAKVVQVRNVSKVFKRDAFEVKVWTMSPSKLRAENFWRSWAHRVQARRPCSI